MRFAGLLGAVCVLSSGLAHAGDIAGVRAAYCPAMANAESYAAPDLENYKILIQGQDDWVFRSDVIAKKHFTPKPETLNALLDFQGRLKALGTTLVIVLPPTQGGAVHGDAAHNANAPAIRQNYLDALRTMRGDGLNIVGLESETGDDLFFRRDHHWNTTGAKMAADSVAAFIRGLSLPQSPPEVAYNTAQNGTHLHKGAYAKAFKTICGTDLPPETAPVFVTAAQSAASHQADLFGDAARPAVILTGTSNAAPDPNVANFDGFLKQALSADVLNLAIAGAGVDTSLISALSDAEFHANPPSILIWEIPGYYNLDHVVQLVLPQARAALHGPCDRPVAVAEHPVSGGDAGLITLDQPVMAAAHYVSIRFNPPLEHGFEAVLQAENTEQSYKINRSRRSPRMDDPYYLLTAMKSGDAALRAVSIRSAKPFTGQTAVVHVCPLPVAQTAP